MMPFVTHHFSAGIDTLRKIDQFKEQHTVLISKYCKEKANENLSVDLPKAQVTVLIFAYSVARRRKEFNFESVYH